MIVIAKSYVVDKGELTFFKSVTLLALLSVLLVKENLLRGYFNMGNTSNTSFKITLTVMVLTLKETNFHWCAPCRD